MSRSAPNCPDNNPLRGGKAEHDRPAHAQRRLISPAPSPARYQPGRHSTRWAGRGAPSWPPGRGQVDAVADVALLVGHGVEVESTGVGQGVVGSVEFDGDWAALPVPNTVWKSLRSTPSRAAIRSCIGEVFTRRGQVDCRPRNVVALKPGMIRRRYRASSARACGSARELDSMWHR
jgi:hypothetical protein